ncbi:MAG: class I SAM-dependent methyltransferase [Rickettsiales bacterium]
MRRNDQLKEIYNSAYSGNKSYAGDKDSFFTFSTMDITQYLVAKVDFTGKTVLEVGCGTGETAMAIAGAGAKSVYAVDYAQEAIKGCKLRHQSDNLVFDTKDYHDITEFYDVVVLQEVIEHLDHPEQAITDLMQRVKKDGILVVTCPNFTNIRGYIWMTLQLLLDVPMSLTDIHFFSPFDFEEMAKKQGFKLEWSTFAHDRVYGENLIIDMRKRLTNALRDAKLDNSKVEKMMQWLEKVITIDNVHNEFNGGKGFYVFSR